MPKVRIGIIGSGSAVEWGLLPLLAGPDMATPPDEGAWWNRRPAAASDIRWQAGAQPEIGAICDVETKRALQLSRAYRVPAVHPKWEAMLAETALDAVFCTSAGKLEFEALLAAAAAKGVRHLWFDEPPAEDHELVLHLFSFASARGLSCWWSRPLRHTAAHRAAFRLLKRGEIGDITALSLRWNSPLDLGAGVLTGEPCAAIDLLLGAAGAAPMEVFARTTKGTTTLWIAFAGGATATALFSSSDAWNAPLPRLEIVGTQGRSLVCEGGRRMGFFQPRDAARWIEPTGIAAHVSAANLGGLADDVKAFLQATIEPKAASTQDAATGHGLEAARALQVLHGVRQSLGSGQPVRLESLWMPKTVSSQSPSSMSKGARESSASLALPLH